MVRDLMLPQNLAYVNSGSFGLLVTGGDKTGKVAAGT